MCEILDIKPKLHIANTRRVARNVLMIVEAHPQENSLVKAMHYRTPGISNMDLLLFIINHCFPSPLLHRVENPSEIEDVVLEILLRESMGNGQPPPSTATQKI